MSKENITEGFQDGLVGGAVMGANAYVVGQALKTTGKFIKNAGKLGVDSIKDRNKNKNKKLKEGAVENLTTVSDVATTTLGAIPGTIAGYKAAKKVHKVGKSAIKYINANEKDRNKMKKENYNLESITVNNISNGDLVAASKDFSSLMSDKIGGQIENERENLRTSIVSDEK